MPESFDQSPEGRLASAIFGKPVTVPDAYRPKFRATVRAAVNNLNPKFREPLINEFELSLIDHPMNAQLLNRAIPRLKEMPLIQSLTIFTPYDPNQLGKILWQVDFGFELREQLAPLDILIKRVSSLTLSSDATQDVRQFYPHRDVLAMSLARFFGVKGDKFSLASRLDIKQATETLQKS